ncbi:MAG: hypothetical protein DSM106950_39120 [Stigonema ocellatum SAG 48.90 = DSM 106950]|nr:hypothetical protein [Stigonema ocellatum SAG 48.90 = DSM 106950]
MLLVVWCWVFGDIKHPTPNNNQQFPNQLTTSQPTNNQQPTTNSVSIF